MKVFKLSCPSIDNSKSLKEAVRAPLQILQMVGESQVPVDDQYKRIPHVTVSEAR